MDLIGIDKTVIKNFTVKSVDMNKLQSESNVDNVMVLRNCKNRYNYFMEQREDNFNLIKITDNTLFNGLKIDVKKIGENSFIQYATLDLSIKQKGNKNHLIKLAKLYRKDQKQWIKSYLMYLVNYELKTKKPLLSDIEDLKEVIKAVDKNNYSRNWKQIEKSNPELECMIGVNEKVQEIFNKIISIE
jgi:hypothetical protein